MWLIVTQTQSQLNNLFHYFHVGVFQYYHQLADSKDNVMKEGGKCQRRNFIANIMIVITVVLIFIY